MAVPTPRMIERIARLEAESEPEAKRQKVDGKTLLDQLQNVTGMAYDLFASAVIVSLPDEAATAPPQEDYIAEALELVQGRYWMIGKVGEYPVFRQEPVDDGPNNVGLFLH